MLIKVTGVICEFLPQAVVYTVSSYGWNDFPNPGRAQCEWRVSHWHQ